MDSIAIRYGENLTLPIDTGDITDVSADIYIGKPGEVYIITKHTALINGVGTFLFLAEDTKIPLDTYYYQINTTDANGYSQKYPSPDDSYDISEDNFPKFIIAEALDLTEIS